jgi:hypothetical protein
MIGQELHEILEREPFEPFRIRLSRGDAYEIRRPGLAIPMKSRLFIALPDSDRWTLVPFRHIAAIESLGDGAGRPKPRRRRRQ